MINYFSVCFLTSLILAGVYIVIYKKTFNVFFTIFFTLTPITNLGFLLVSISTTTEGALYGNALNYLSATFLPVYLVLAIFSLCKITIPRHAVISLFTVAGFCFICTAIAGHSKLFYTGVHLAQNNGVSYLAKDGYGPVHAITYVFFMFCALLSLLCLAYSFRHRNVPRRTLYMLCSLYVVDIIAYFIGRNYSLTFESMPGSLVLNQLTMLLIIQRYSLYNVDNTVTETLRESFSLGYISFDKDRRFLGCNSTAESWFPELGSLRIDHHINQASWLASTLADKMLLIDFDPKSAGFHMRRDGHSYRFDSDYLYMFGKRVGYRFCITDDTQEQKLIESAVSANKAKSRFLANMSHEIRTPINAILGLDMMILRENTDQTIRSYALDLQSAGQTLLSIVNDVLDQSKIEAGKMDIIPVEYSLVTLVSDISNMISPKADSKNLSFGVEVDPDLPTVLHGDDIRLRQILLNLLSNAVKYTDEGGVTLKITGRVVEGNAILRFTVSDTGIGIKEEDYEKLKTQYGRLEEQRNRNVEGTGLGISIVSELLSLMNSSLSFESVYGQGSTFSFKLIQPVISCEPVGDIAARIKAKGHNFKYTVSFVAPRARLLVVDDNPMNLSVFTGLLKQTRVQIDTACNGAQAIDLASREHYDIIFLDHMMPGKDGVETFREIRELPDSPNPMTPVIALTANAVAGAREKYLQLGFTDFISKPIDPDRLERVTASLLPPELLEPVAIMTDKRFMEPAPLEHEEDEDDLSGLPNINGVDWKYGRSHFRTKENFLHTIKCFVGTAGSETSELSDLLDSEDIENYRIKVHSMKSSAAILGLLPLSGMAAFLEDAAKREDLDLMRSVTPRFLTMWCDCAELLKCVTEEPSATGLNIKDPAIIIALLDQLKVTMANFDIEGVDAITEKLSAYDFSDRSASLMKDLFAAVAALDTDKVLRLAEELKGII